VCSLDEWDSLKGFRDDEEIEVTLFQRVSFSPRTENENMGWSIGIDELGEI